MNRESAIDLVNALDTVILDANLAGETARSDHASDVQGMLRDSLETGSALSTESLALRARALIREDIVNGRTVHLRYPLGYQPNPAR